MSELENHLSSSDIARFNRKVDRSGGTRACWPWIGTIHKKGQGVLKVRSVNLKAHRTAYVLANGRVPDGLGVLHECDNPPCCNPSHLFVGTQTDNIADMDKKGRRRPAFGERNGSAKMNPEIVLKIRELRSSGIAIREIARRFPFVTRPAIRAAIRCETWKQVQ